MRTIVTSPEFFAPEAYRAKVKTPFEFVVSAVRATGADASNALPLVQSLRDLGMPLYVLPAADRLRRQGRSLGQHRRAAQPHELRGALASGRMRGVQPGRVQSSSASEASASLVSVALAGDLSEATATTVAKATRRRRRSRSSLGSPEFQKR